MAWCPECRTEYKPGILKCADCGTDLVDSLDDFPSSEDSMMHEAEAVVDIMLDADENAATSESEDDADQVEEYLASSVKKHSYVYQDREEKSADFKSSGYVLTTVGILGIAFLIAYNLGLIPIHFGNRILMNLIMSAMFLFFIVFGILSLKSASRYKMEAVEEKNLTKEIKKWFLDGYTAQSIDQKVISEDQGEELKYLQRVQFIHDEIDHTFLNLEEDYLDCVVDSLYQELYDE